VQSIGLFSPQQLAGVRLPMGAATVYVLGPLKLEFGIRLTIFPDRRAPAPETDVNSQVHDLVLLARA
jgi:hypothetical protein